MDASAGSSRCEAVVILLEQAGRKRASAEQARRLAESIMTERVAAELKRHAAELELTACEIEEHACAVAETAETTESLSAELAVLLEDARQRIASRYPYRAAR
jgi:predicted ArsR family transcriptional regulator